MTDTPAAPTTPRGDGRDRADDLRLEHALEDPVDFTAPQEASADE